MKAWIENSFFDFDAALLSRVEAFVEQNSDNASMQLLRNTIAKQKSNKTTTEKLYQHLFVHSDQDVPKKKKIFLKKIAIGFDGFWFFVVSLIIWGCLQPTS